MSISIKAVTPNVQKLYPLSMLVDLRRWRDELRRVDDLCGKGSKMEEDGSLFEQDEAFVEAYLAAQEEKKELEAKAEVWSSDLCEFMGVNFDKLAEKLDDMLNPSKGKNKKKKTVSEEMTPMERMSRWADLFNGNLWGDGGKLDGWSAKYLDYLADYMCSDDALKSSAFDAYIKPKIEQINQDMKRRPDYKSAQSLLLEKLEERKRKNPKVDLDDVLERYMENVLVERANTFGSDNHFFRCMASGTFYLPEGNDVNVPYSDYFLKNYGEKFYLNPNAKSKNKRKADFMNIDKMLPIIADTYGKEIADDVKCVLKSRGIREADWGKMNSYDLAKVMQKPVNAAKHNTMATRLTDLCEGVETPYQEQARRLGFMLTIGKEAAVLEKSLKADLSNNLKTDGVVRGLDLKMVQMARPPHYSFAKIWKDKFQDQFSTYADFVTECANVYKKVSGDFAKNGYSEYYEKWVEAMSQRGDYYPKFEGIKRPYEINIHHKMPVKMAKMLDRPADINNPANYLMFVEFEVPTGEKLTKHLQEHAKESGSTASMGTEPDARFYCSSGGLLLSHKNYKEPESFTKLRDKLAKGDDKETLGVMILEAANQRA